VSIWGFISDVHGNLLALERAIAACRESGAQQLVYLGDLLGRGDSDGCVERVVETAALSVVGNRDLDWAERVSARSRAYVLSLPRLAEADEFVAVHGDARLVRNLSADGRKRGFERAYCYLRERGKRLLFFGHTHQARVWRKSSPSAEPELLPGRRIDLTDARESVYFVNVGTTGLPFPGKGPPCCAVYDDVWQRLEHLVLGPGRGERRKPSFE